MMRRFLSFAIVLVVTLSVSTLWWINQPLIDSSNQSPVELSIDSGSSVKVVADLASKLTGANQTLLWVWLRCAQSGGSVLAGKNKTIRAGTYEIESHLTPFGLYQKLVSGDQILLSLTIPEGWTFSQMRAAINAAPSLKHTTLNMTDAQLMVALGKSGVLAEGRFFPDTYTYAKNASDISIYKQALAVLDKRLEAAWNARLQSVPFKNSTELLILASIVEKETGKPSDRAEIAGVFVNRLKKNMLLQTDPTVIYGMGERFVEQRRNIRKSDLTTDTPYNTYTRAGLPPGPIALVGKAALEAASQPRQTDALYFVARGDGSSQFSTTLAQHNAAVKRFILGIQ